MSLNAMAYLFQTFWPYLLIALAIGILTGWFSQSGSGRGKSL